jgi:PEGA domain.
MKKSIALLLLLCFIVSSLLVIPQVSAAGLYTVHGTVLDRRGNPVAGATVELVNDETSGASWLVLDTKVSDKDGKFDFVNVASNSDAFMVFVTLTSGGKTYKTDYSDMVWTDGSQGIVQIDTRWTTLHNYPSLEYGHFWGRVDGGGGRDMSGGVVYALSNEQRYYSYISSSGDYDMVLPIGTYKVYAQYPMNGRIYQSAYTNIEVTGGYSRNDNNPFSIQLSLSAPASNPDPSAIPGTFTNTVNGTVFYKDGTTAPGTVVSLWQSSDDGIPGSFLKKDQVTADGNGHYQFNDVKVTTDPPESNEVYGKKTFLVSAAYVDSKGNVYVKNQSLSLYNPNVILGIGGNEQAERNKVVDLQIDYSPKGWIQIKTDPAGAKVYVDGKQLFDANDNPLTTPCTAYIDAGNNHRIRLVMSGYSDKEISNVPIVMGAETESIDTTLDKPLVPGWVVAAAAVLILLIVVGLIFAVVLSKRHMFMGPLSGVFASVGKSAGGFRESMATKKDQRSARKAHAAEMKRAESARRAQMTESSPTSNNMIDGRKRDQGSFRASAEQPRLPEYAGEDLSMVSARDIYRRTESSGMERIPNSQSAGSMARTPYSERDMLDVPRREPQAPRREPQAFRESPIAADSDGRMRVPKAMPTARDQPPASSLRDKERVIQYVRERGDGVSFIQMSNELEIPPNTLTIITKELVINDDIEKVRGLYFYKSRDTSQDENKSSVVVWRLDGED